MKMKKFILGLAVILGMGIIVFVSFPTNELAEENTVEESKAIAESELRATEESKHPEINMGILPSDIEASSINLVGTWETNQIGIEQRIHDMTHQKVYAEFKQGAHEMNEENINALLLALERSVSNDEIEYCKEVLSKWKDGDFSNAVEVHNKLWLEQGGTIGKAERLLTPEEEQEFVENNFK